MALNLARATRSVRPGRPQGPPTARQLLARQHLARQVDCGVLTIEEPEPDFDEDLVEVVGGACTVPDSANVDEDFQVSATVENSNDVPVFVDVLWSAGTITLERRTDVSVLPNSEVDLTEFTSIGSPPGPGSFAVDAEVTSAREA